MGYANPVFEIVTWLRTRAALTGVTISATVPTTRTSSSGKLLVVRRVGGAAVDVRDVARLDVMAWDATEFRATELANIARTELLSYLRIPGRVLGGYPVYRIQEFSGPTPYPDPAGSDQPVIIFTEEITFRMGALV